MNDINETAAHCPTCGAEYRSGFDTCADDHTPLLPGPAPVVDDEPPRRPTYSRPAGPPWEPVAGFASAAEARLLAGRLNAEGIEAFVDPPEHHNVYGSSTAATIGYRFTVLLPPHRILEAADVVERLTVESQDSDLDR